MKKYVSEEKLKRLIFQPHTVVKPVFLFFDVNMKQKYLIKYYIEE